MSLKYTYWRFSDYKVASIIDDSAITSDEIIQETKTVLSLMKKKIAMKKMQPVKQKISVVYLTFY